MRWNRGCKKDLKNRAPEFFACGPNGMLKAVGDRAIRGNWTAWLSMDNKMGCGVGACLTCVQKIRRRTAAGRGSGCAAKGRCLRAGALCGG